MFVGSTVFFTPFISSTPELPILLDKNFFLSLPTPWWWEMHPPYFMISSLAESSTSEYTPTGSFNPWYKNPK